MLGVRELKILASKVFPVVCYAIDIYASCLGVGPVGCLCRDEGFWNSLFDLCIDITWQVESFWALLSLAGPRGVVCYMYNKGFGR